MKYHEYQKKQNLTKVKDLNLTFDRLYEKHYSLKQIQEFQDPRWKKNHIQKGFEKRLKTQMRMFYKKRKKSNTQRIERPIYKNNNSENGNLNILFQTAMKR